jgi:diguanylate cyclase (GGDEF)-like protein
MRFLAQFDAIGSLKIAGSYDGSPERQMIISLVDQGYVNGLDAYSVEHGPRWSHWDAVKLADAERPKTIGMLLTKWGKGTAVEVGLTISHKGRVRLAELEQQLKTGRDRDETGILWAKHHVLVDLAIAILSAAKNAPLSVAFLDMNGLTEINPLGHSAGDAALRAFFQAAAATLGQRGDVYRNGGDEVVAILPGVDDAGAIKIVDAFVRQLGKDALHLATEAVSLTACCGTASTLDPNEDATSVLDRADQSLLRAKPQSGAAKVWRGRVSAYAVGDGAVATHAPGTP